MTATLEAGLRRDLVEFGLRMWRAGYVVGPDGNLSCRVEGGMLITPTRLPYERTAPEHIARVFAGGRWEGPLAPSSEFAVHAAIYAARADVQAIIHAHPIHACVLAVRGEHLPPLLDEVEPVLGGEVRVADYVPSGRPELGATAVAGLGGRHGVILARHGTVTTGPDLATAFYRLEVLERAAHVHVLAASCDFQAQPAARRLAATP